MNHSLQTIIFAILLTCAAWGSSPVDPRWNRAVLPRSTVGHRAFFLGVLVMHDEFERLYREICDRPFAASDIGWHCVIAEPDADPQSLFVEPLFRFHSPEERVALQGHNVDGKVVVHRIWWTDASDIKLLNEFVRMLVKPGQAFEYPPPINRNVTLEMLPGPVGELHGRSFDWIWIVVFLDWIAEQKPDAIGLRHELGLELVETGGMVPAHCGPTALFTETLFRVVRQIDFPAIVTKSQESPDGDPVTKRLSEDAGPEIDEKPSKGRRGIRPNKVSPDELGILKNIRKHFDSAKEKPRFDRQEFLRFMGISEARLKRALNATKPSRLK